MRRFTGRDVPASAGLDELEEMVEEARYVRSLEVGVMAEAIAMAFGSKGKGRRR